MSSLRERIGLAFGLGRATPASSRAAGLTPIELPMQAELFSVSQLELHAKTLASGHELDVSGLSSADHLLTRLAANEVVLREAHELVTETVQRGTRITPAAEWFIDNYYLIEEQIRIARRHLPRGYSRELPRLKNALLLGTPRVYDIALELISHSHGRVDIEGLRAFIAAYQSVRPLRLGELWAIPIMLRMALIENLCRVVAGVTAGRRDRDRASYWVEQLLGVAASDSAKVVLVLAEMVKEDPPLTLAFVAEFAGRLQGQGAALMFPVSWLEHRMAERGQTVEAVFQLVSQDQAANQVAIGNSIGSLRLLGATDWRDFVEALSVVERTLRTDPSGVYRRMDFATRDSYRLAIEGISKRSRLSEDDVAHAALELGDARAAAGALDRQAHVGYFLIDQGRELLERKAQVRPGRWWYGRARGPRARAVGYASTMLFGTALGAGFLGFEAQRAGFQGWTLGALFPIFFLCASQLTIGIVHWAVTLLVRPRRLPRLDFSKGIPDEHRTVVVVPTLLTDVAEVDHLLGSLEVRFLANRDPNLSFALLSDFRDASQAELPGDAALLVRCQAGIRALNATYAVPGAAAPFFSFHRKRQWNLSAGVWMGRERKRGKLEDFNAAVRGDAGAFDSIVGDLAGLQGVRYAITLDSDTDLPRDAARQLASTIAHPLNRPVYDEKLGRVSAGYGILQPRVAISLASAGATRFARLFGGEPGIDPYTRAVSDVYQDVFGEGSFVGKGLYDIDAFTQALSGRLPSNRILSHDLLEGAYARSGLVSDVLLFEDHPPSYAADVSRRYRWLRGDWQITPWLSSHVPHGVHGSVPNPISALSRWKILDNLRRSLLPVALLLLLGGGWWWTRSALVSTLGVVTILVLPGLLAAAGDLIRRSRELELGPHARDVGLALGQQLLREAFALACLPYDALLSVSAITRTALRVLITGRQLLEWRTARDAHHGARRGLAQSYAALWIAPFAASALALALSVHSRAVLAVAAPVLGLWLLGPAAAWWLSQPIARKKPRLDSADRRFLRLLARRTWRFFETFVTAEDNHLPPDNFQEDPKPCLAHRTSPTNIGLALTANLAAYDLGYIRADTLIERTRLTLAALDRLERYRGHFYNWYDTRSLEPLRPAYVSTVDSGNLTGHLRTLAVGLRELAGHPILRPELFGGLADTLDVLTELGAASAETLGARLRSELDVSPDTFSGYGLRLEQLSLGARNIERELGTGASAELVWWASAFSAECASASTELSSVAPWHAVLAGVDSADPGVTGALATLRETWLGLDRVPTLKDTAELSKTLLPVLDAALEAFDNDGLRELRAALLLGAEHATARLRDLDQLAARSVALAEFDYAFLYDPQRHLLSIGYHVADNRLDSSFYDLLASEARLASFIAIAQGKLPEEHWFALGRLLTRARGQPSLLSWSGSMFEYLMPLLIMPSYDRTLLHDTYRGVVERQIEYGRERGVPWGVSESGYNKTDAALNYQYRAFGIPGLGFKRGLAEDLVIAPYATALALMVNPEAACANLRRLARESLLDRYGLYEAVDYTRLRLPHGKDRVIVHSYMAHHQGMTLLALDYLLCDQPMQRRFDADPSFRATLLLLEERVPRVPAIYPHPAEVSAASGPPLDVQSSVRVFTTPDTPAPEVHLLSNGTYHVAITNSGGGYSRWRDLAVTRWHEDPTRDSWGSFCYVRDKMTGAFWSVAHQPSLVRAQSYEAIFSQGRAEFRRRDGELTTHVEISISPEDDIELRRISITNRGRAERTIEVTSYAEVVLNQPAADAAHPAFSNLFVETELLESRQAILGTRRPRSSDERPPWLLHLMTVQGEQVGTASYETDRAEFIGRGRSAVDPAALHREALTNSAGAVLDPVLAIRNTVCIQPDQTLRLHLVTGVAETREAALGLVEKYSDHHSADRVFELSWTQSQVVLRRLDLTESDTQLYERLASHLIYANPTLRAPRSIIAQNKSGQSGLWAYGISGDLPIVLVKVANREQLALVRQLAKAHTYWRLKGLVADLVIWNEDNSGYRQVLQEDILEVIGPSDASLLNRPGGIFVRRSDQLSEEDKILLQTVARLLLSATDGPLAEQVNRRLHLEMPAWLFASTERILPGIALAGRNNVAEPSNEPTLQLERPDLVAFNGLGGFTNDGREYVITTTREVRTPAPWVNVLANPWFGSVVSESGGAYTWCENAHTYRLTPWHNDPVGDASGEALYIRDEIDGRFWSPTPLPCGGESPYSTRHGFGYSVFEHTESGLSSQLHTFVATDAPLKFLVLKLKNHSGRARRVSLTAFFELVLGERRSANLPHVVSEVDPRTSALLARNAYNSEFSSRVAFLDASELTRSVSGDRLELLGRNGNMARPAFIRRAQLSGRVGASLDPCLAMQVTVELPSGQEREVAFIFGSGRDLADARTLVQRFRGTGPARVALEGVWAYWSRTLGAVNVQTPDVSLNFLVNGWLLYQVLASRMWGRSGFYQSGGAFGFRDQLQDAMALVHAEPGLLREQILRSASRQFLEGDVQHWWHPPLGRGVRTHISDDYLWLPYALCRYVSARGDTGILKEKAQFLEGRGVQTGEDSYYDLPIRSEQSATVYEHCRRAIEHGFRWGEHGLPLMGSGDWNDGMNLVGEQGRGESVWLAFFLYDVLSRFVAIARLAEDEPFAVLCGSRAAELRDNIERHAWDGGWYRRAYFDNGEPLGSKTNVECQIDSLPQSWSVLSGAGSPERSQQALQALDARLVRRGLGLIQLFDPPFDTSDLRPGYVKGYLPGVRENGGQYTHAAVWAVMAFAAAGDTERAWELFGLINPVRHGDRSEAIAIYKVEPYVVAADVYTNRQHAGRGGWTWYTGSAGWMYRLILESLLGLRLEVDRLHIAPLLPRTWKAFDLHYRYGRSVYHIRIRSLGAEGGGRAVTRITSDGTDQAGTTLLLRDDAGEHRVEVEIGGPETAA